MTTVLIRETPSRIASVGRHGGWLPDRPSHKDWRLSELLGHVAVPENPTLDPETYPTMRDQGRQGSCTGHSFRNALMQRLLTRDREFWEKYDLSPASAYYNARKIEGSIRYDTGAYIRDVMEGAAKAGVAREDHCPYDQDHLTISLTAQAEQSARWHQALHYHRCDDVGASTEATVDNILRALVAGLPVVFGFTCFANLSEADDTGVIPLPGKRDEEDGGHCMCIYSADTTQRMFIGPNSWGTNWGGVGKDGQRGYFALPFDYFLKGYADDAWAVDHE
jgi:C1A family cysteine protease